MIIIIIIIMIIIMIIVIILMLMLLRLTVNTNLLRATRRCPRRSRRARPSRRAPTCRTRWPAAALGPKESKRVLEYGVRAPVFCGKLREQAGKMCFQRKPTGSLFCYSGLFAGPARKASLAADTSARRPRAWGSDSCSAWPRGEARVRRSRRYCHSMT